MLYMNIAVVLLQPHAHRPDVLDAARAPLRVLRALVRRPRPRDVDPVGDAEFGQMEVHAMLSWGMGAAGLPITHKVYLQPRFRLRGHPIKS